MSALKSRLQTDLTAAMKSRDELRTATIRMALSALSTEEVAGKVARELSDDEVLKVLTREAKKRREAADAFASGGRPDRAEREEAEGAVLAGYLPAQLSDDELAELVRAAIGTVGADNPQQMGAVMKVLTPEVAGRADGKRVAGEVRRQLAG
ncbi:MAG: GatB/YqeY domain-containing protein [Actinomycetota bacterium]|nr:GatB/YqeY domain-containing protein [Actinomycetota bacterium]